MTECERIINTGLIDSSFLEEETRCEYTISPKMKKVWAIELDLLREFEKICSKYNLRYWVGFGTLLGAIRHHGFIPWDDDMDVWMPREDYDRLLSLNIQLDQPYFLQTTLNDVDYYSSFARIRNGNTTGVLVSKNNKCNNGIYIDIYPLDGLNKNSLRQLIRSKYVRIKNVAAHAYTFNINPNPITRGLHALLRLPLVPYDQRKTYLKVNEIARSVSWGLSDKVGFVVFAPYAHEHNMFDKADFDNTVLMPFENIKVPVPSGYDHILRTIYGDYMRFPPVEKRGLWHDFEFEPDVAYYDYLREIERK